MKWYETRRRAMSPLVERLVYEGRGWEIMEAIKNEQKSKTGVGTFNGISVKRLDRNV